MPAGSVTPSTGGFGGGAASCAAAEGRLRRRAAKFDADDVGDVEGLNLVAHIDAHQAGGAAQKVPFTTWPFLSVMVSAKPTDATASAIAI